MIACTASGYRLKYRVSTYHKICRRYLRRAATRPDLRSIESEELLAAIDQLKPVVAGDVRSEASNAGNSKNPDESNWQSTAETLNQSPLTDRRLSQTRFGHKNAKRPDDPKCYTDFQKLLNKNPYAHALATPVRADVLTGFRLPSYFLLKFGLAIDPRTGKKWQMPNLIKGVDKPNIPNEVSGQVPRGTVSQKDHQPLEQRESRSLGPEPVSAEANQLATKREGPSRLMSGSSYLCSHQALERASQSEARLRATIPHRWKNDPAIKLSNIVWREDMADFVLTLLRREATSCLMTLSKQSTPYVIPCESGWDSINQRNQVACVLYLGSHSEVPSISEDHVAPLESTSASVNENDRMHKPQESTPNPAHTVAPIPKYAMRQSGQRQCPVYDLPFLLGRESVAKLREARPQHFQAEISIVKLKRATLQVQYYLWRLLGYLSHSDSNTIR